MTEHLTTIQLPPTITFSDNAGMVEALRSVKNYLELSNALVDELCGFTPGHTDKLLGPTGAKNFSPLTLNAMFWCLAVRCTITIDIEKAKVMADHWEKRNAAHYRPNASVISKVIVERVKPLILKDQTHNARMARSMGTPPKKRSSIARKAARVRWLRHRERERTSAAATRAQFE